MDIKTISNRIEALCKERGWSYYRLTKETGLDQSVISSIIRHKNMPTLYTLDKICNAFNISLSVFFDDDFHTKQSNASILNLWTKLHYSDKQKVLIYIYGLLHKTIEGDKFDDI